MQSEFLNRIELHLTANGVAATRFGRAVVGDPRFVEDLRAGRIPRERTMTKVAHYLDQRESSSVDVIAVHR